MKVAVYIENGVTQLVLTPEGEWEKNVTDRMASDGEYDVTIMRGEFYECRGGWFRQGYPSSERSLILRADRREPRVEAPVEPLTPEWCVDAFYRVNPGAKDTMPNGIPSLYLLDFARAVEERGRTITLLRSIAEEAP